MVENKAARFYVPRCVLSEFDLDTVGFSSVVKPGFKDWDGIAGQASPQVSSPLPSIPVPFSPFLPCLSAAKRFPNSAMESEGAT